MPYILLCYFFILVFHKSFLLVPNEYLSLCTAVVDCKTGQDNHKLPIYIWLLGLFYPFTYLIFTHILCCPTLAKKASIADLSTSFRRDIVQNSTMGMIFGVWWKEIYRFQSVYVDSMLFHFIRKYPSKYTHKWPYKRIQFGREGYLYGWLRTWRVWDEQWIY